MNRLNVTLRTVGLAVVVSVALIGLMTVVGVASADDGSCTPEGNACTKNNGVQVSWTWSAINSIHNVVSSIISHSRYGTNTS